MSDLARRPEPGDGRVASRGSAPDADSESALARLLDVVLDKGVLLDLELVITVARVPLIAVNLRATIAGVETMLEWGVPGIWSEGSAPAGRRAVQASAARPLQPAAREEPGVEAELPAALPEARAGSTVWRPGTLVLQGDGVVHWRGTGDRRPALVLDRRDIAEARIESEPGVTDPVLVLATAGGAVRLAVARADEALALLAPVSRPERPTMVGERVP